MSFQRGSKNPRWNGGKTINQGYVLVLVRNHPNPIYFHYVYEHRLVMEKYLGRYLKSDELVHHLDRDKLNNNIDNLQITTRAEQNRIHIRSPQGNPGFGGVNNNWKKLERDLEGRFLPL